MEGSNGCGYARFVPWLKISMSGDKETLAAAVEEYLNEVGKVQCERRNHRIRNLVDEYL